MENKLLTFMYSSLLLLAISCKNPEDPDLCQSLSPVKADFLIREELGDTLSPNTDTINVKNSVVFESAETMDVYKWQVGNDPKVWNTKQFKLSFIYAEGQTVPVTLIVNRSPNKTCFPNDDGIDTITKTLFISESYKLPILGTYSGYNTNDPQTKFDIKIDTIIDTNSPLSHPDNLVITFANLPNGCNPNGDENKSYGKAIGGKYFNISTNIGGIGSCYGLNAFGSLDTGGKSITIKYSYETQVGTTIQRKYFTYKGIKQ